MERGIMLFGGLLIVGLGFAGGRGLPAGEELGFVSGALTLGGAVVICWLFSFKARWHGVGGAMVVGLAGLARNADAAANVTVAAVRGTPLPAGEAERSLIALVCFVVVAAMVRATLAERARRRAAALRGE